MTDPRMSDYDDFASYLHNPFSFRFLSQKKKQPLLFVKELKDL